MLDSLRRHFRQSFVAGLLALIPLVATFWILKTLVTWTEDFFLGLVPVAWHPQALIGMDLPGVGLVVTLLMVLVIGMVTRTYVAKRFIALGEYLVSHIPIARGVYPGIKRLIEFVIGASSARSTRVVMIPYPAPPNRAYAFVTSEVTLPDAHGRLVPYARVFVPTTPNPTSGFLLLVPVQDTIPTDLTIEQASKLIVSGGLV